MVDPQPVPDGIPPTRSVNGSEITGLSTAEADRIALADPVGHAAGQVLAVLSEQLVSATLGKDSLHSGLIAGIAGLIFVMIFLLRLLRLPGR